MDTLRGKIFPNAISATKMLFHSLLFPPQQFKKFLKKTNTFCDNFALILD